MMPEHLQEIERELRRAAAARLYGEVRRLANEFCGSAWSYTKSLPPDDPRLRETARKIEEVLGWAIVIMQLARAASGAELQRLRTTKRFMADISVF